MPKVSIFDLFIKSKVYSSVIKERHCRFVPLLRLIHSCQITLMRVFIFLKIKNKHPLLKNNVLQRAQYVK